MNAQLVARNAESKTKKVTLYAEYRYQDKCKRVPTGIKIHEKYWDAQGKLIRANGTTDVTKDNQHLKLVLTNFNELIKTLYIQNGNILPSIDQINASLAERARGLEKQHEAPAPEFTVIHALDTFMEEHVDWAVATRKGFATLKSNISAYQTAMKTTWLLATLTNDDIIKWQKWLLKTFDYKNATLGKRVRLLRQLLRAKEATAVQVNKIKPLYSQLLTPPVVLNQREIEAIRSLDLHFSPKLERVRDLLVAQVFSGLRFSDLIRLRKDHIQKGHVVIRMQKTNLTVRIPIFPPLRGILDKYTDHETHELSLPALSNQKFNEYIKELCQFVPALRKNISIESKKREKTIATSVPKWELITSHSSRRSFCTLCLDLGYSAKDTMQWSGHRTMAAFSRYIGLSDLDDDAAVNFEERYNSKLRRA